MKPYRPKHLKDLIKSKEKFSEKITGKSLANGQSANIYKIENPFKPSQTVCYKVFDSIDDEEEDVTDMRKHFAREIDILIRARHPCTAELLYFDPTETLEKPMCVEIFYEYGSLLKFFQGFNPQYSDIGPENFKGTKYTILMYGIARGIRYLHMLKMMHRDIKPENIVIDANYYPHVTDFDLSKVTNDDDNQSGQVGSQLYMAPEVKIDGDEEAHFSYPADVFSLSKVFYEICESVGKPHVDVRKNLITKYVLKEPLSFINTPLNLRPLIERMWDKDPEKRPTIDQVCQELETNQYPDTDSDEFTKYKKEIDEYEEKQLLLVKRCWLKYAEDLDLIFNPYLVEEMTEEDKLTIEELEGSEDPYELIQYYMKRSALDDGNAEFMLGLIYLFGTLGIPKDFALAWRYFTRAKKHENVDAAAYLQSMLRKVRKEQGFKNIKGKKYGINDEKFQQLDNDQALLLLGMIKEGNGDYKSALKCYMKSASQENPAAKSRIGILLLKTRQKIETAKRLLEEAIESTNIDEDERKIALLNLGVIYLYPEDAEKPVDPDELNKAIEIFENLASQNVPDAFTFLTIAYGKANNITKERELREIAKNKYGNMHIQYY